MKKNLYVGSCGVDVTYEEGQRLKCGLHAYSFDTDTREAEELVIDRQCVNPAYVEIQDGYLYAGNEYTDYAEFSVYRVNRDGSLEFTDSLKIDGSGLCQISVAGKTLFGAEYWVGNAVSCAIDDKGRIIKVASLIHHEESSVIKGRQDSSHVHSMTPDRSGKFVVAADLGGDNLHVYKVGNDSTLTKELMPVPSAPGDGPRHMTFSYDNKTAYLLTEITSKVIVYDFNEKTGELKQKQVIQAAPEGFVGKTMAADIQISPDGKFLYTSNRGADVITVFSVDMKTGMLKLEGYDDCFGEGPRSIAITPDGEYIAFANRGSHCAVVSKRNKETGRIGEKIWSGEVTEATCVKWG